MDYSINIKDWQIALTKKTSSGVVLTSVKEVFLELKEGRYTMEIKRVMPKRSTDANRYLWACYGLIAEEVGYIVPEMDRSMKSKIVAALHEIFKDRYIWTTTIRSTKDRRKRIKLDPSTKEMDSTEFTVYLNKIRTDHPYLPDASDKNLLTFIDTYYFK